MLVRVSPRLFERDSGLPTLAAGEGNHAHNGTTCAAPLPDAPAVSSLLLVACFLLRPQLITLSMRALEERLKRGRGQTLRDKEEIWRSLICS